MLRFSKLLFKTSLNFSHPREDGSEADTAGMALVFTEPVSELDAGLYICHVSYHHRTSKVYIRVDVTSEETQHSEFSIRLSAY